MKIAFTILICLSSASVSLAQQETDVKKDRARISGYLNSLSGEDKRYFYGLYVDHNFTALNESNAGTIKDILSKPNEWSGQHSILISSIADLDRLEHPGEQVVVYGPQSMMNYVRHYVVKPEPPQEPVKRRSFLAGVGRAFINGYYFYSPYRPAYFMRWSVPYTLCAVQSNPNSLSYYVSGTNTNKYLSPSWTDPIHP